jgi:hypothetical protein
MPLDDAQYVPPASGSVIHAVAVPGLRTNVADTVTEFAAGQVVKYAPADIQRNALYVLSTSTSGSAWTNAKATMDWVTAMNTFRDNEITNVRTLNFTQLTTYIIPSGWPAPPSFLTPNP